MSLIFFHIKANAAPANETELKINSNANRVSTYLIGIMSFANFVFYPLVIGFFIALIIEQIFR